MSLLLVHDLRILLACLEYKALNSLIVIVFLRLCFQQSNDEAKGGREFVLMAGFPPKDLIDDIDNTIESCKLEGQAITVRWKS